ncbi:unnamed protein product (macronuclear) [Paramecium tetraurelia]|uniref:Autophagy-related protein n=1 Tax=Paramecium tetraurelia TaxID=5888 RepID=A0CH76_PARTE|nr:uncharacterized protein GSPATT00007583001 [Paramecium tetraurelia]CAK70143.1 unnamed protein product [Paramecium tetraurelia]|eukprot:XP_001437540.1 hypothetical protein (macronuclear) [Paramecium tetraurelia strain d4-2]
MYSIQERQVKFKEKLNQNPEMIPIILEKHPRSKIQGLKNQLYIYLYNLIQFRDTLKCTLQISPKQSLYFHIGNQLLPEGLADIYQKKKDPDDGFLYITYSDLEVFGFISK